MFHYSYCWQNWRRVLIPFREKWIIEVTLTPSKGGRAISWEGVSSGNIRKHRAKPIEITHNLSIDIRDKMVANIGEGQTFWLINHDFVANIDWEKFFENKVRGSCYFDLCKKTAS